MKSPEQTLPQVTESAFAHEFAKALASAREGTPEDFYIFFEERIAEGKTLRAQVGYLPTGINRDSELAPCITIVVTHDDSNTETARLDFSVENGTYNISHRLVFDKDESITGSRLLTLCETALKKLIQSGQLEKMPLSINSGQVSVIE